MLLLPAPLPLFALWLAGALALAWALDLALGEPPNRWHPVAWLGQALAPLGRGLSALPPAAALLAGAMAWAAVVGMVAALAWWLQRALLALPAWAGVPLLALALKPSFAWRMLRDEVAAVQQAFEAGGLAAARARLAWLCSRDVNRLDAEQVRETAIETLAENFNDSLVAPLCWALLAGLPGAWAWRAVNTLDAMWGYRGPFEWAGKCAARADDGLAWLPARLSALLLWPGVPWAVLRAQAARTPSPNGGWPMAAMALRLNVRLRKPGAYALNDAAASPGPAQLQQALAIAGGAAGRAVALAVGLLLLVALAQGRAP